MDELAVDAGLEGFGSLADQELREPNDPNPIDGAAPSYVEGEVAPRNPRVLFCSWTELDVASGTPVILCDLLRHFPPGDAEVLTEDNPDNKRRRKIEVEHPIHKYRPHTRLWPFMRGHRVRGRLARLGVPLLVATILRRIKKFRPDCLFAVYAQSHWILAAWIASRLSGVPLIYYVHDTFLEQTNRRKNSAYSKWLDRRALSTARVLVLHPYLADYYHQRYGIECTVLRQIIRHPALPPRRTDFAAKEIVIGFSGAIYDNNRRQLAELARVVEANPRLRLKIWSDAAPAELDRAGIAGERVECAYEADYERLLTHLAGCDLLYLPLAFFDTPAVTTDSLQYAFPTKSLDYLVSGTPILVHSPKHFELSRFFASHDCGHVVNEAGPVAVEAWLQRWLAGAVESLDDSDRLATLRIFSPEENRRLLWVIIAEETASRGKRPRATTPTSTNETVKAAV
ncbi:MAG TPA: glycosyltransferase [Pirellulales bacterium]|nr:glycosyltransferase [Pirellulales bacterium]